MILKQGRREISESYNVICTVHQYGLLSLQQIIEVMWLPSRERMKDLWKCIVQNFSKLDYRMIFQAQPSQSYTLKKKSIKKTPTTKKKDKKSWEQLWRMYFTILEVKHYVGMKGFFFFLFSQMFFFFNHMSSFRIYNLHDLLGVAWQRQ